MSDKVGEFVRTYWAAIAALVMVAAGWGTSTAQLAALQQEQKTGQAEIGKKIDKLTEGIGDMKEVLAGLKIRDAYAQNEIAELRRSVRELEKRR